MKDEHKILRYDLENKEEGLTPKERLMLAALNDLKEGEATGRDLRVAQESVKTAERELKEEEEGKVREEEAEVSGAENVQRVKRNQD